MNNHQIIIISTLLLIVSTIAYIIIIPLFKSKQITQTVRTLGPRTHYLKNKTPILGGIIIVLGTLISLYLFLFINPLKANYDIKKILILLIPFVGYFFLGLIDDLKIITLKDNEGISIKNKFFLELIIAIIVFYMILSFNHSTIINFYGIKINLYFFYGIFLIFFFMSYTNAVNFTDGIDGLAAGISLIVTISLVLIADKNNNKLVFYIGISLAVQLIAFLFFNLHKAQIFMGDTGSLAIGGGLASMAILLKAEMILFLMGIVYFLEALSVVIQIFVYKKYHKRIFKMAPIHHHLELIGLNEWQIDFLGWGITIVFCLVSLFLEGVF